MTRSLNDLLRDGADAVAAPRLDVHELVAEADRRHRRRRVVAVAAVAVSVVVAGSVLLALTSSRTDEVSPAGSPSPSTAVDVHTSARPLVYAEGRTVHVGARTVETDEPVAFIAPTDDGAVYEAMLDGTLWFTDGTTTQVIGTSGYTAAPTAHPGVVSTGSSGSLVVWADVVRPDRYPVELVVYDTSRGKKVARIPVPERGRTASVEYVGEDEVWYSSDGGADRRVHRFDVRSGEITSHPRSDLQAVLRHDPRAIASVSHGQVGADAAVTLADGSELRLRLPNGYVGPWPADEEPALAVSQWLDDDRVVLWADDGGGDLPAKEGDLLVCRLPDGVCRVVVARTSHPYVAPYPG
ncbi:MAG TPA: hypothetical protein VNS55_02895 [Nocardioides sp.]|nr:hypothetical protein [Nocardioides sp.]